MAFAGVNLVQVIAALMAVIFVTPFLGGYMFKIFSGQRNILISILRPVERAVYRVSGIQETDEMNWKEYAKTLLIFNLIGIVFLMLLQMVQAHLPLNPEKLGSVSWHLAFNTAVSFVTNTNWQAYSGENTLSYLTQMLGLGVQNFVSAATGLGVLLAIARGISNKQNPHLGNFWVDLTRGTVHLLLPLSVIFAIVLMGQGVIQNFLPYDHVKTVEGYEQVIPQGPAASQIAIKQLGSNGGGFFGVNSAHPFENPTPLTNFLELIAILAIAAGCTYLFGLIVGSRRQGWVLFGVMMTLMTALLAASLWSEYHFGSMEGKETRFGMTNTVIWSVFTTVASNGSVNGMLSSMSPLSGGIAMLNMMLGEVIFGGVGAGMYGILLYVILTVFLAGLMVGRTPEYLGKKIEAREITWVMVGVLAPCATILLGSAVSVVSSLGLAGLGHQGPHGLSEILYAFSSAAGNNGSAFGSLSVNTVFYNLMLGVAMLIGRFAIIIPVLIVAGSLSIKKIAPPSSGTFKTDSLLFGGLLAGVILIVGALTFFPALSLGPILEHLLMVT
ncbi:potassium-transporting ATPase subunit KdpA [Bdellovibrio sp. ZAP7]|uniref:potassium-transporting ATPase subunit KdpA n=1 Tax=Bdellovibrio sp. ZAP7 TaxID=2231053 RepID=UPI0011581E6A|nr:potassium-transporting ATPase subunit KdpA [Bdellovibrio sp. ZAP7]QDK45395.1 potassium-transporting ATPase subunit KdpA [Bdellovibrio sp. ZAP7]